MDTQLKKGVIELIILHYLNKQDYYTYELNQMLSATIDLNESTAYAIFKKLIDKQFVTYYFKESNSGPARKYYKITDLGQKHLKESKDTFFSFIEDVKKILEN